VPWQLTSTAKCPPSGGKTIAIGAEGFGPVTVVIPFEDEADAIRIANDTRFGLAASVWTNDIARAHRVASRLLFGMAVAACDFQGSSFVRGTLYIGVAVHAGEHAAVDRIFKSLRIDMQADWLAVDVVGQGGIAMASETFLRGWFRRLLASWLAGGKDGAST